MSTPVVHNGKTIGVMDGDRLVKKDKQVVLYRKYDGWAIPVEVLKKYRPKRIQLFFDEQAYQATIDSFRDRKKVIFNDFEGEAQVILPRKYWSHKDLRQQELIKE